MLHTLSKVYVLGVTPGASFNPSPLHQGMQLMTSGAGHAFKELYPPKEDT